MSKCVAFPFVRTKDGMKRSKFFMDLLHYGRTREQAKEDYFIGTNEEFLRLAKDVAEFDENGEITYESYNNLVGVDTNEENLLKILEADAKVGTYSYGEAVTRLQQFNKNNPHKDKYLATLELSKDATKYHLKVVRRTPTAEAELEKTLRNQHIQNSIIEQLKKLKVAVDFLENPGDIEGRYSTVNAERTNDGLYHLIRISQGAKNVSTTLAEEAGHFAVGALGHNPLVVRLQAALANEDVRRQAFEVLEEKPEDRVLGHDPARELAGILVGRALIDEAMGGTFLDHMINRIAYMGKKIFAAISLNAVRLNRLKAEEYARKIAQGFMSSHFEGNVENALKKKETLYEAKKGTASRAYKSIVLSITNSLRSLQDSDRNGKITKRTTSILKETTKDDRLMAAEGTDLFDRNMVLSGIVDAVRGYVDLIGPGKEITSMLGAIDLVNDSNFFDNMAVYGSQLAQIRSFVNSGLAIIKAIDIEFNSQFAETAGAEGTMRQIRNLKAQLQEAINIISGDLVALERDYFCRYCEQIYGQDFIETSRRVVFVKPTYSEEVNPNTGRREKTKSRTLIVSPGEKVYFSKQVEELDSDIYAYERLFASMSNNSDIIGQVADLTTRLGRTHADEATNASWDYLEILNGRWAKMKLGSDQSILFEKFDDGSYTGNLISELHWGQWERDREEFITSLKEEFKNNTPNLHSMSEVQASMQFEEFYLKPRMKQWNYEHSVWNQTASRWEPAAGQRHSNGSSRKDYSNPKFREVISKHPDLRKWYDDYMEMKWDLDKQLPPGSTLPYRVPQFRGTLTNRMRNREVTAGGRKALGFGLSVRRFALDTFCATGEDYDFGCMGTVNSIEEDLYRDAAVVAANQPRRIPIFGVNKIKDTTNLSTDLCHSTLCYAAMSHSYNQLSKCIDALKVGQQALLSRKVGKNKRGIKVESDWADEEGQNTQSYRRYIDFLDKVVYGISVKPELSGSLQLNKFVPEKLVSFMTRVAAYMFLGFNYVGGVVNTGTGFLEIFKESMVGDFINIKSVAKAHKLYFFGEKGTYGLGGIVDNWMDMGKQAKDNKTSLFCREFDVDSKTAHRYRDWYTTHKRWFNWFAAAPYLGYSSGDHYMQSISYIAMAYETKLYDADGNETNLYEAYKLVDNKDSKGNVKGKTLQLGTYFKTREGIKEYRLIEGIEAKMANINRSSAILGASNVQFNAEEKAYLNNHGIDPTNVNNTKVQLKDLKNSLIWTETDKSKFQNKAREINNRLHGIYDRQNSVGFSSKWWGNALLSMRGWMLGWAQRRFAPDHYSLVLGQNVEGSAVTFAKTILYSIGGPKEDLGTLRQRLGRLCMIVATGGYGSKTAKRMEALGLSQFQQGNIRRNTWDFLIMVLLMIIKGMTAQPPKEERDKYYEPDPVMGRWHYVSGRLLLEQGSFSWMMPMRMKSEFETTLNIMPSGGTATFEVLKLMYEASGLAWADKDNSDIYYQKNEPGKYEEEDPKVINHLMKYTPLRNIYTWKYPYKAYESYESFTLNKRK